MDPLTGYLILAVIIWGIRGAFDHARADRERTREQELRAATAKAGKAGGQITPSARNKLRRQHRAGWWASEVRHGFPVHRTGIHTGWLAHQAAAMHTRAQREAARTTHLDAAASFASAVRDHRARQAVIRAEIEKAIAESAVEQDGTRRAVKEAAGAVILPFPERREAATPAAPEPGPYAASYDPAAMDKARGEKHGTPGPHAPPATVCRVCTRPGSAADPLVPAGVGFSHRSHVERGNAIVRAFAHADPASSLSDHLRPGDPPCEACDGRGTNPDRTDACAVCRGWGSADPDPATLAPAPEGAVCAACGRPGTPGDPVLTDPAGKAIHRSHLAEAHEFQQRLLNGCTECGEPLYLRPDDGWAHEDCARVSNAEHDAAEVTDDRDPDVVEAELRKQGRCPYRPGTDQRSTYCGRDITDTGGDEPDEWCLEHACTVQGDDEGAAQERNERVKELLHRDREDLTAHSTATEGEPPMSGDTTFSGIKASSAAAIGLADQDQSEIGARKSVAYVRADEMLALDVDPAVIDAQMSYADALAQAEKHLAAAGEQAASVGSLLERYHGGMEEATVSAPGKIADREFHGEG